MGADLRADLGVVAAFLLLQVRDYKRLFAFSTVEHMGIIFVAAGLGSSADKYGALYQIVCHTVTKSFCSLPPALRSSR